MPACVAVGAEDVEGESTGVRVVEAQSVGLAVSDAMAHAVGAAVLKGVPVVLRGALRLAVGCSEMLGGALGEREVLGDREALPVREGDTVTLGEALREGVQLVGGEHRPGSRHTQPPWHSVGAEALLVQ